MDEAMNWVLMPLKRWNDFSGRSRRKEYWMFWLACAIVNTVLGVIEGSIFGTSVLSGLLGLVLLLPSIAVAIRRLHDSGKSGWWLLLALTGIGAIVILVFLVLDSQPGTNKYGSNPKGN